MTKEEKQKLVDSIPFWWHTMDFGDGIITPGAAKSEGMERLVSYFPDLKGKTVLDIGAWDGYYSFKAEELGAKRVLATDKPVWCANVGGDWKYSPEMLGKRGFDIAHLIKNSKVESRVLELMELSAEQIGTFDVVLFLGVWYHLEDPWISIKKLAELTNEMVVVETQAIYIDGFENMSLLEFYDDELGNDKSNWFAFNLKTMKTMFRLAGFRKFILKSEYPPKDKPRCRISFQAIK